MKPYLEYDSELINFLILWGGTKSLGTVATSDLLYKP
jgi:hypothetical protein